MEVQQTSINHLPDEILVIIFAYLSTEDIIISIRKTCVRWKLISFSNQLWRMIDFTPLAHWTDLEVANIISSNPQIKNFVFKRRRNYDDLIKIINFRCNDVSKIVIENKHGPYLQTVMKAVHTFPKMETFETILGLESMCHDMAKLFGEIHELKRFAIINKPATLPILKFMVYLRREILITLAITCKITSKSFKLLCSCTRLKYLNLYSCKTPASHVDISPLSQLKDLETLQLVRFPDAFEIPLPDFKGNKFSKLTRLEICEGGKMLESMLNTFLLLCPRIKHLNLFGNQLQDSQIENIRFCKYLGYLDVSYNYLLSDTFLAGLSSGCHKLKTLDISYCRGISEAFILILCPCTQIETIILEGYDFLGSFFKFIPWAFPNLKELHVKHFHKMDTIRYIKNCIPLLDITRCSSCPDNCIMPH